MTLYLLDLASHQQGIDLTLPAYDEWDLVNIKTSQGDWYIADRTRSRRWADQARATGKGIMTFHWLDASTSGAEQARIAYHEMRELGGPDGMAHQADTEDDGKTYGPLTWAIWRDYVNAMQDLLGRHVLNYTGDWWWQLRGWNGAVRTPYLMAAPNAGYLAAYPGDQSGHWSADYGGWETLAAMQYRVGPIPDGGPGSGSVSQTAIRDPAVWAALTGGSNVTTLDMGDWKQPPQMPQGAALMDLWLQENQQGGLAGDKAFKSERSKQLDRIEAAAGSAALSAEDRAAIVADLRAGLPTAAEVAAELIRQLGG